MLHSETSTSNNWALHTRLFEKFGENNMARKALKC